MYSGIPVILFLGFIATAIVMIVFVVRISRDALASAEPCRHCGSLISDRHAERCPWCQKTIERHTTRPTRLDAPFEERPDDARIRRNAEKAIAALHEGDRTLYFKGLDSQNAVRRCENPACTRISLNGTGESPQFCGRCGRRWAPRDLNSEKSLKRIRESRTEIRKFYEIAGTAPMHLAKENYRTAQRLGRSLFAGMKHSEQRIDVAV